jgi:hypothetical protein
MIRSRWLVAIVTAAACTANDGGNLGPVDAPSPIADAAPIDATPPAVDAPPPDAAGCIPPAVMHSCHLLTQVRDDGAPNCGSDPSIAIPEFGCYGLPNSTTAPEFGCACAGTLGHREICPAGDCYLRSGLPGTFPLLYESSSSMSIVIIASCAPLTINNTQPEEARDGAEPYSCPEMPLGIGYADPQRATGPGERCMHLWFWQAADQPIDPILNELGVCIDFTLYTWDHDGMANTPEVPWTLPETTDPHPADLTMLGPNHDLFWGAAPYPIPLTGSGAAKLPRASDFGLRLGAPFPTP